MPVRTLDTVEKSDALRALLGATDPEPLLDAIRKARLALEFRAADAMIGLDPVDEAVLDQLRAAITEALVAATALGSHVAAVELAREQLGARDVAAALATLEPAVRARDPQATALAAETVWRRQPKRHAEALAWLQDAREPDPEGRVHYMLGLFAFNGVGRPVDLREAGALHEIAAARGNGDAMFELYVMTAQGIGRTADEAAAIAWCLRAAEAGNLRAMGNLGAIYATGEGLPRDPALALQWYERAAKQGHGKSAATLGVMHATGDCVEQDRDKALRWFRAADEAGYDWSDMAEAMGLDPDEWEP